MTEIETVKIKKKINSRNKGRSGEQDVARILNDIIAATLAKNNKAIFVKQDAPFQRNQNQSAIGGADLTNPYGLSIEIKRQETLNIPAWWRQCCSAAQRTNEIPILIYRINRKPWAVMMNLDTPILPRHSVLKADHEIEFIRLQSNFTLTEFEKWLTLYFEINFIKNIK